MKCGVDFIDMGINTPTQQFQFIHNPKNVIYLIHILILCVNCGFILYSMRTLSPKKYI